MANFYSAKLYKIISCASLQKKSIKIFLEMKFQPCFEFINVAYDLETQNRGIFYERHRGIPHRSFVLSNIKFITEQFPNWQVAKSINDTSQWIRVVARWFIIVYVEQHVT